MDTKELKHITQKFSLSQLETCICQQLEKGDNICDIVDDSDAVIEELSRATVIRELMDQGYRFSDALRELARRIRSVYGKENP